MKPGPLLIAAGLFGVVSAGTTCAQQNPVTIDFSYAGYAAAAAPIPRVKAVVSVRPTGNDDTWLLQSAIDHVAALPVQPDGFRGAVLLRPGRYLVSGHLQLSASGVVLRGSGSGTTIVATGNDRRTLVQVGDPRPSADPILAAPVAIADDLVPTGARSFTVAKGASFSVGQHVVVRRPSTPAWIKSLGMTGLPGTFANARLDWAPGSHDLVWDRTVTAFDPVSAKLTLDAPLTTALEAQYGGGTVAQVTSAEPLAHVGVEDLTLESAFDPKFPKDEDHSWMAIALDHVEDAWVANVTVRHFVSSAVFAGHRARRITVEDVHSEAPVSEPGGYRRQSFLVYGQQVLIERSTSEAGMNDFATGLLAAGPNVFLDDAGSASLGASGSFEGWASGVLYENVRVPNAKLQLIEDQTRAQGAGWTAANSVAWNSSAQAVEAVGPPQAPNFAVTSPKPLYATELTARGLHLQPALDPVAEGNVAEFKAPPVAAPKLVQPHAFGIVNGRFTLDGKLDWGESQGEAWWKGSTSPAVAFQLTGSSISRFMPGQIGPGLTEDLPEFAHRLHERGIRFLQVGPGLWYDHRRDAHTVTPEPDANVWAPFFEMPWARSGTGTGFDGLSKFDVSRYNPWYFARHREFAQIAAREGILIYFDLYNNHNVLEIGPHWIDFPWRPANSVNQTGLPEPPPYHPGGTRLDVGNEFFDPSNAPLRKLHHDYILHVLDELGDQPNILFGAAYQFAGPLAFEQFFQDTIAEWEQAHHRKVRVALTTGKNTTDAILADPVRRKQIAVVDMRYWVYEPDGTLFAPNAGENHAFREQIQTKFKGYSDTPPPTTPELVYKQVREYRDRFPDIAWVPMESGAGPMPILMGGGAAQSSLRGFVPGARRDGPSPDSILDQFLRDNLAIDLMKLGPVEGVVQDPERTWALAGAPADPVLLYSLRGPSITLAKALPWATYHALWFDPNTGVTKDAATVAAGAGATFANPDEKDWLLILRPLP